jgi:phosphoglycolate phosphatase
MFDVDEQSKPHAILLDLDGTLVDSAPDLTCSLNQILTILDVPLVDESRVRQWIGNGVDRLLHRALTNSVEGYAQGDEFWRARNLFFVEYQKQSGNQSRLYETVFDSLKKLSQQNIRLACITNKNRCFTLPLLKKLEVESFFDLVVCGDDLTNKKPHPEPLLYAVNQLGVDVEKSLMVGDSKTDIDAANAASMAVVCVDYGYSQGKNLSLLNINGMISNLSELIELFSSQGLRECG